MKTLLICLLLLGVSSQPLAAELTKEQMLKRLYEMRQRFERERQQEENEARANIGVIRANAGDAPSVSQMRREMGLALSQISNNYRCLDVEVENNGGNTVVVCGNNNGQIQGENTHATGDVIGAINTVLGSSSGSGGGTAGAGGTVNLGPLGNSVNNSGLYVETNSNTASNTSLVKGDVNGVLNQSNIQANGDIGNRTAVVNN